MFETTFSYTSSTPLPPHTSVERAKETLHEFETVIRLSPDCRGCRAIEPPVPPNSRPEASQAEDSTDALQFYEVEDDLPFIPKRLWSGGVKYRADFRPTSDGCDITIYAPGGFTSINHWRILRDSVPEDPGVERTQSKDMLHADAGIGGWYVQIVSDAKCNRTFAGFVKGFLKNSHGQLQAAFVEKVQSLPPEPRARRPTLGRRKSSTF